MWQLAIRHTYASMLCAAARQLFKAWQADCAKEELGAVTFTMHGLTLKQYCRGKEQVLLQLSAQPAALNDWCLLNTDVYTMYLVQHASMLVNCLKAKQ